jgi:hypothetical protein
LAVLLGTATHALHADAGRMALRWDPVAGAAGYRIYIGSVSEVYDRVVVLDRVTEVVLLGLPACEPSYVSIKAYNSAGESTGFSNEVVGWPQPEVEGGEVPVVEQGGVFEVALSGANFADGTELIFEAADFEGHPLLQVETLDVVSCGEMAALLAVEPAAPGFRAMEVGRHSFRIVSPEGVIGVGTIDVELKQQRLDINRSDATTRDRVDGKDLVWLAYSHGTDEGEQRYNPDADLNGDGEIDGEDLAYLASGFGGCWTGTGWRPDACPR